MKTLYAPWREPYVVDIAHDKRKEVVDENNCLFCETLKADNDEETQILGRYAHNFIIMNKFPYNAGHILVLPYKHTELLHELDYATTTEMMELAKQASIIIQGELKNEGTNIGINIGRAAGAGIPAHVHLHVLPRWRGDTNFLPVLADVKLVSADMERMYHTFLPYFKKLEANQ